MESAYGEPLRHPVQCAVDTAFVKALSNPRQVAPRSRSCTMQAYSQGGVVPVQQLHSAAIRGGAPVSAAAALRSQGGVVPVSAAADSGKETDRGAVP